MTSCSGVPISIRRDDIVDAELLTDLLDTQMQHIGIELFSGHGRTDRCREAHEAGSLVLINVTPSVALLAAFGAIYIV